jgi:hypothetical protein
MPSFVRPEVLQLGALIAVVIPPIQLDFDSLDLVLLWQSDSVVDLGIDLIARPGEWDGGVKIEPALLKLIRAPILIDAATMAPYVGRISIPGIRITAGDCRTGRGRGLVCSANKSDGKCC